MRSELIVLLALASFTQGSYAPTLKITYYGLSHQQMAVLNKIIDNQEAVTSANYKAMKSVFAKLCDLKSKADEDDSGLARVTAKVQDAVDISYDSILIALEKSCSAVESARNASHGYVNDVGMRFATAIKLAQSGDHYKNRDAIEVNQVKVEKDVTNAVKRFYDAIRTCLRTTDAEEAVIKAAHDGSLHGFVHLANAAFNAFKVKAAASTSSCEKRACVSNMQDFENKVLVGVSDDIEYKFSLLKTHFICSHVNQGGIFFKLFLNQYALTASYRGYKNGNTVVFDRIIDYLKRIYFGLSDDGNLDFSQDDLAVRTAIAFYNYADGANFASFFALHPDATSAIAIDQENVFNTNVQLVMGYFDAVHVAAAKGAEYSNVISYIAAARDAAAAATPIWIREYLRVIRNNEIFSAEIEAEFAILQEIMIDGSLHCTNSVLDAVGILAEATYTSEVRTDDFYTVRGLLDAANSGCGQFTEGVSAASFLVLVANNAS